MPSIKKTFQNFYRDSVSLMQLSATLTRLQGIDQAIYVEHGGQKGLITERTWLISCLFAWKCRKTYIQ